MRHFKAKLEEKAPLPPDLQWPPVVPVVQVPKIDVAPVADQAVKSTSPPVKARSRPSDKQREAVEEVPPDLPEGTITIAKMADQLGINRSTLAEHAKAGKLEHIAIPIASRPGKYTRYFSPEQQIAARTWHASITIKKPKQENLFDG
ncbi:MAG: hypothetical protein AUF65_01635 [Chloroflexi bacterium 13_1_20CM_50_12]|nr:MAG: hypothetical protein AUF65_01635 [Chloroflexi bacterium 13_1_20CM_50_12]